MEKVNVHAGLAVSGIVTASPANFHLGGTGLGTAVTRLKLKFPLQVQGLKFF